LHQINSDEISEEFFIRRRPRLETFSSLVKCHENFKTDLEFEKTLYYEFLNLKKLVSEDASVFNMSEGSFFSKAEDQRCKFMAA